MESYNILSKILGIFLLLLGAMSLVTGIWIILTNGLGMPLSWMENTVFGSYLIPGLIMAIIIGGFNFTAGILLLLKRKFAIEITASAGFALLIWIFTEMYLIRTSIFLQTIFFIVGIIILIAAMFLIRLEGQLKK